MSLKQKASDERAGPGAKKTAGKRLKKSSDFFDPSRFRPLPPDKLFVRGLVEVQFVESARSGVEKWNFDEEQERQKFAEVWTTDLTEILGKHNLLNWRPSFPLRYPWTPKESDRAAREAYFKDGRDKFVTFSFPREESVLDIANELRKLPEIKKAVAIPEIGPPSSPLTEPYTGTNDQVVNPCYGCLTNQWYLFRCCVPGAWAQQATGNGVVIADIDWGCNISHDDLRLRVDTTVSRNVFPGSPNPMVVDNGRKADHGTAVLGQAGAAVNDAGMAGIAFNASLWAIQAGTDGLRDHHLWVAAINYVRTTPSTSRKVIILEIQTGGFSNIEAIPIISQEIVLAIRDQIVVCVPAGNRNTSGDAGLDDCGHPIDDTGSIVVGATNFHPVMNQLAESNGGNRVVVYAPGDSSHDLTLALSDHDYNERFGGTSGATAKVAGVVALMLEKNNQLTPGQIREILKHSNKPVLDASMQQIGVLLDANQAVAEARGVNPLTVNCVTVN